MMYSMTDKLVSANTMLEAGGEIKISEVGKLLAAAGAEVALLNPEVLEFVEVVEEFECIETILTEFVEFEVEGMFATEEKAVEAVLSHAAMADIGGSFEFAADIKARRK